MNKVNSILVCLVMIITSISCQKDYSVESTQNLTIFPTINTLATGSLQDASGDCLPITVNGNYIQDSILNSSNYITVTVNFTVAGKYKLHTDTTNGCWFSMDTAATYSTGIKTVNLQGHGAPKVVGTSYFNVFFKNSFCSFSIVTNALSKTEKDYFPMSIGSYWIYDTVKTGGGLKDTIHYAVSPDRQVLNGNLYTLFSSSKKNDTHYYRKDYQGHYYEYTDIFLGLSIPRFDYMFLDDTKPVGSVFYQSPTFTGSYQGQPTTVSIKLTIKEKNIRYTFSNSITFDSVIHVEQTVSFFLNGVDLSSSILPNEVYYAKKIGFVTYNSPTSQLYINAKNWDIK